MQPSDIDLSSSGAVVSSRFDMYRSIHKALRACMADTLQRVGNTDSRDQTEVAGMLAQVREMLMFCAIHLKKENEFIHPIMEARRPGSSRYIEADHEHHAWAMDKLMQLVIEIEQVGEAERETALLNLYRYLGIFIAENLTHMNAEETDNNAVLWATHSDDELSAVHQALVAASQPEEKALAMRWMLPALNHGERVAFLSEMRSHLPPVVFDGILAIARERLRQSDYRKLMAAMQSAEPLAA